MTPEDRRRVFQAWEDAWPETKRLRQRLADRRKRGEVTWRREYMGTIPEPVREEPQPLPDPATIQRVTGRHVPLPRLVEITRGCMDGKIDRAEALRLLGIDPETGQALRPGPIFGVERHRQRERLRPRQPTQIERFEKRIAKLRGGSNER